MSLIESIYLLCAAAAAAAVFLLPLQWHIVAWRLSKWNRSSGSASNVTYCSMGRHWECIALRTKKRTIKATIERHTHTDFLFSARFIRIARQKKNTHLYVRLFRPRIVAKRATRPFRITTTTSKKKSTFEKIDCTHNRKMVFVWFEFKCPW